MPPGQADEAFVLRTNDLDLLDLARHEPALFEVDGAATGLRLVRLLGHGAMATVFEASLDPAQRGSGLSSETPLNLAVKIMKPSALVGARRLNLDPFDTFTRERAALERMMKRGGPDAPVVEIFGCGRVHIGVDDNPADQLPWLAIERVDGGPFGTTLSERVALAGPTGFATRRALRLVEHLVRTVEAVHDEGIIHRDLKPDNVLLAGPPERELPKLADCGVARVDGLLVTVGGVTPAYGGPEQLLSVQDERNPLVGPWTDSHAVAAIVFFVLSGEHWCKSQDDRAWHEGFRRSLSSSAAHARFPAEASLTKRLDEVLSRGASPALPEPVWDLPEARRYRRFARSFRPTLLEGAPRTPSVSAFAAELLPLLSELAATRGD